MALPEEVDRTGYQIQVEIRDRNQFGVRFARSALGRSSGPFGCFQFKHRQLPVCIESVHLCDLLPAVFRFAKYIK